MIEDYFCSQLRQSVNVLFPLANAEEVISLTYGEICPVPGVSPALLGVVNQRGKLLWVLELSDLLQIAPDKKNRRAQDTLTLLVLSDIKNSDQQVGCVVSALKGIIPIDLALQSLNSNPPPAWESLKINNILFADEKYTVIDVQAVFSNISELTYSNKLVDKS
ncbi:MAG: chemotaxis protein CheW [Chroococcus sp. CMT-3BRIN-NPC107]|jgi:twitching motility protein PilI|nr:chemotaxis protein CheW [Chroococcus sp. CMT-3BRIN-NPC107]